MRKEKSEDNEERRNNREADKKIKRKNKIYEKIFIFT
jgi:hypothetical protein